MKKLRDRLTYANVIATVALFLALGGGAYAATQLPKNSIGSKQLKNGSITPNKLSKAAREALKGGIGPIGPQGPKGDPGTPATKLWAFIDSEAKLVRGSGVTSVGHPGTGRYSVVFNQDVSGCAFLATPAATGTVDGVSSYASPGMASIVGLAGNSHGVVVTRTTENGTVFNYPVMVAIFC